jgi:hypothetical protein
MIAVGRSHRLEVCFALIACADPLSDIQPCRSNAATLRPLQVACLGACNTACGLSLSTHLCVASAFLSYLGGFINTATPVVHSVTGRVQGFCGDQ